MIPAGLYVYGRHFPSTRVSRRSCLRRVETNYDPTGTSRWASRLDAWGPSKESRLAGLRRMNAAGREPHAKWCVACNDQRERKQKDTPPLSR